MMGCFLHGLRACSLQAKFEASNKLARSSSWQQQTRHALARSRTRETICSVHDALNALHRLCVSLLKQTRHRDDNVRLSGIYCFRAFRVIGIPCIWNTPSHCNWCLHGLKSSALNRVISVLMRHAPNHILRSTEDNTWILVHKSVCKNC